MYNRSTFNGCLTLVFYSNIIIFSVQSLIWNLTNRIKRQSSLFNVHHYIRVKENKTNMMKTSMFKQISNLLSSEEIKPLYIIDTTKKMYIIVYRLKKDKFLFFYNASSVISLRARYFVYTNTKFRKFRKLSTSHFWNIVLILM